MERSVKDIVHQRVIDKCWQVFEDGHYKEAALDAMIEVEKALADASGAQAAYGHRLVDRALGPGKHVRLVVPLGEERQEQAKMLLKGAFGYYRNYAAHNGSRITETICLRVMVLASELLDPVGASARRFDGMATIEDLIQAGVFESLDRLEGLLNCICGGYADEAFDGMFEDIALGGWTDLQYDAVCDLGLVELETVLLHPPDPDGTESVTYVHLSDDGERALACCKTGRDGPLRSREADAER